MNTVLVYSVLVSSITCLPTIQGINEFFANNFINFIEERSNQVQHTLTSSYERALKINDYVEEQQNKINAEISSYIKNVKDRGSQIADSFSYLPTEDSDSKLQNPDTVLSVPARIARNGYVCETHTVISEGYLLNLHRIPHSKNDGVISSKTILLQHGIFSSSADWIMNGPDKALAYVLADAGYDVWMANLRGNVYSKEHAWLKTDSKTYWNFSWHEIALYDVPAILQYIMKMKGEGTKITYIGHSMGTTILFAMLALRPEYNQVLTAGYALAPVVFMTDFRCPVKPLAPFTSNFANIEMIYGFHEFLPKNSIFGKIAGTCNTDYVDNELCKNLVFTMSGDNEKQYNETLLSVFLAHYIAGTSWKTVVHFAQAIVAREKFQQFDYGPTNNIKVYGSEKPPEYDLSKISMPIKLFWAQNDLLSGEKDVKKLLEKLPPTTEDYLVPDPKFNHLDYLWAKDANRLLNANILDSLQKNV